MLGETQKSGKKFRYMQLKEQIEQTYIDMPPLSPMPGERELCEKYGVSRSTVRRALNMLEEENLIIRMQGRGAFFNGPKMPVDPPENAAPFYYQVRLSGDYTSSKVLMQNIVNADEEVAQNLEIEIKAQVYRLERLRYVRDIPVALSIDYIPYNLCPELLSIDFTEATLFTTMEGLGLSPYCGHKIVSTRKANKYESLHLNIEEGEPVTEANTVTVDKNNLRIVYNITKSVAYQTVFELYIFSKQEAWPKFNTLRKTVDLK